MCDPAGLGHGWTSVSSCGAGPRAGTVTLLPKSKALDSGCRPDTPCLPALAPMTCLKGQTPPSPLAPTMGCIRAAPEEAPAGRPGQVGSGAHIVSFSGFPTHSHL